jgi:hypothetical protein
VAAALVPASAEGASVSTDPRLVHPARFDPLYFIKLFCWIRPAEGGVPIQFNLWPFQEEVLTDLQTQRRIVILKARQLGLSWLVLAYVLWLAMFNHGQTILIVNRNLDEAKKLLARVRFMWERIPDWLRLPLAVDNAQELAFAGMDSRIISLPATEDTGSGETATFVLVDEGAKIPGAEPIMTALLPTLSAERTTLAVISTAKGYHNYFANLWKRALPGSQEPNDFWPIFIPNSAHPDRDAAWEEQTRRTFPTVRAYLQEYPERWQDAFQQPGEAVFDEFDRMVHVTSEGAEATGQWPKRSAWDFGYHFSPVYLLEVRGERHVHVFDEIDGREMTTEQLAVEVANRLTEWRLRPQDVPAGVDPAGVAQTSTSTESDHAMLRRHGFLVPEEPVRVAPKDRVDLIKQMLRDNRLTINGERCPYLLESLEQAQWARKRAPSGEMYRTETYEKDGYYEHPLDSLGYGLINTFPPRGRPAAAATVQAPAAQHSQSSFG